MKRFSPWFFIFILIFHVPGFCQDSTRSLTIKICADLAIRNNLTVLHSNSLRIIYFPRSMVGFPSKTITEEASARSIIPLWMCKTDQALIL